MCVMKKCSKCKINKNLSDFPKRGHGQRSDCRLCHNLGRKHYRQQNPELTKKQKRLFYLKHKLAIKQKTELYRRQNQLLDLCPLCASPRIEYTQYCLKHWLNRLIKTMLYNNEMQVSKQHKQLLVESLLAVIPTHCPYTSEPLYPGFNLSLEHKLPTSSHPQLAAQVDNLQWTSKTYNHAKHTMTNEEFNRHYQITYIP